MRRHGPRTIVRALFGIHFSCVLVCCPVTGVAADQPKIVTAPVSGGALDLGADLAGTADPRAIQWPGKVWGNAGYSDTAIQFYPPPGHRVHIISASGTVSSFAHGSIPRGATAGLS